MASHPATTATSTISPASPQPERGSYQHCPIASSHLPALGADPGESSPRPVKHKSQGIHFSTGTRGRTKQRWKAPVYTLMDQRPYPHVRLTQLQAGLEDAASEEPAGFSWASHRIHFHCNFLFQPGFSIAQKRSIINAVQPHPDGHGLRYL